MRRICVNTEHSLRVGKGHHHSISSESATLTPVALQTANPPNFTDEVDRFFALNHSLRPPR